MLTLAATPLGIATAAVSTNVECTGYGQSGESICGELRDKYVEFGGPEGPLGPPVSGELVNEDNKGKRVMLANDAAIYWSPSTGAHVVSDEFFAKWVEAGAENGALGYPTSDEVDNAGSYARFGDRRIDFENGAIYSSAGRAGIGYWAALSPDAGTSSPSSESVVPRLSEVPPDASPSAPSSTTPSGLGAAGSGFVVSGAVYRTGPGALLVPAQAEPETCPAGTTAYPGAQFIYNCLSVDTQIDGYPAGVREGKPDPTPSEVDIFGPPDITGFGRAHADVDHNVGYRGLRLLLRSDALRSSSPHALS